MPKNVPKHGPTYTASLSRREVSLLADWERSRRCYVTIGDIRTVVGAGVARKVARSLVAKGALERLQRGVYLVRPFRALARPRSPSAPVAIAALLHRESYYLGGLWALSFHHLTDQQFVSRVDAFVTRARPSRMLGGARVAFHVLPPDPTVHGRTQTTIEGTPVQLSDVERTLLDVLERPKLAGGLGRAVELVADALPRGDVNKLVDYSIRGSRISTCQRLGVLLERAGAPSRVVGRLARHVAASRSLLSMVPGRRVGHVNRRWNVVENDR